MAEESTGYVAQKGSLVDSIRDSISSERINEYKRIYDEWQPQWFDLGGVKFAAFGDRLLIVEDEFKSGYDCKRCAGRGTISCDQCGGKGHYTRIAATSENEAPYEIKCSFCSGQGTLKCAECDGKGALLVVPETSQRRPSTGRVVSVGDDPKCRYFHEGDNVLYSNFAGHAMEVGEVTIRILHAGEILAQVKGHLELSRVRNEREALGI